MHHEQDPKHSLQCMQPLIDCIQAMILTIREGMQLKYKPNVCDGQVVSDGNTVTP